MEIGVIDHAMNFDDGQQSEADKKLLVLFYKGVVKNETKSTEEGRPIFDEIDLVKIITPGSRDSFVGDATESYQLRFPAQWARYKAGRSQDVGGTPLNMLPWLTEAQVMEFQALQIKTVEQLAGISDALAQKFMGFHAIKQRAQAYLNAAKDSAPLLKMEAELKKRDDAIAQLEETVAALVAQQKAAAAVAASKKGA